MLLMTATPIPRTLEATLYGDLDVTTIRERPPGRPIIQTRLTPRRRWDDMLRFIGERLRSGEQAFFIYPLVDTSDREGLRDATRMHREIAGHPAMQGLDVALLHGKSTPEERAAGIGRLLAGSAHALVATTIVEVGIDLPRATIMVIEHPERFGLAQIHQLRGRIGRGTHAAAYCFLVPSEESADSAQQRLEILTRESDGFRIAEEDLRLRGPGEALGTSQSGFPRFRVADPFRDAGLVLRARSDALRLLDSEGISGTTIQALVGRASRLAVSSLGAPGV
jgi:ATP-dependent DNA helicase RecG